MIRFNEVSKSYYQHQALNKVSFELNKGDMRFITGHSGAGKSTVLKLIAKLETTSTGEIVVDGKNLQSIHKNDLARLRQKIGFISQNASLIEHRNVFENVSLPLRISSSPSAEIKSRVRAALDKVGLSHKEKHYPQQLSVGEQQRVSIARAIINRPIILLADEPTGNLDPSLSSEMIQLLEQFHQVGTTVLIATHDLSLISQTKYELLTLHQGQLHG